MIRYEVVPPRATLTIDEPERRNPLTTEAMEELRTGVGEAASDERVRVLVLTGAGEQAFCAGGDLSGGFVDDPIGSHADREALAGLFRALRWAGKPTVARVNGDALAGGLGLVAACDLAVAVEGARFGVPEVGVGLWPMIITAVLQRVMPGRTSLELMMTGRLIGTDEALRLGVVTRVVAPGELDRAVDETVESLASSSPLVLRMGRDAFYAAQDLPFDAALDLLHGGLTAVALTDDAAEGVAAFLEKRPPRWRGP